MSSGRVQSVGERYEARKGREAVKASHLHVNRKDHVQPLLMLIDQLACPWVMQFHVCFASTDKPRVHGERRGSRQYRHQEYYAIEKQAGSHRKDYLPSAQKLVVFRIMSATYRELVLYKSLNDPHG